MKREALSLPQPRGGGLGDGLVSWYLVQPPGVHRTWWWKLSQHHPHEVFMMGTYSGPGTVRTKLSGWLDRW